MTKPHKPTDDTFPLVSIIVPVYNGERYVRQSLDSILAQSYPHFEVLVMDDASTDGTAAILAQYGDRLRCYRQPENRGIYGNMNDGIAMVQGEYIAIYHADDVYDPTIVEREVAFLRQHTDAGAVFCKEIFIDPDGNEFGRLQLPADVRGGGPFGYRLILNTLLTYKNVIFCCPTCMVPASVYRTIGTYRDKQFRNTSDLDMYLRISERYSVGILDDYLISYRWGHGNSAQKYRHLRTDPSRFFTIMDLYLANGAQTLANPESLRDYEAHRGEDNLMRTINHYILDQPREARAVLKEVRLRKFLVSRRIMRWRLLGLFFLLRLVMRLPRISGVANLFYRRWHSGMRIKKTFGWRKLVVNRKRSYQSGQQGLQT
jgi:glycosyltransferase involved in cell wall biosynthesis